MSVSTGYRWARETALEAAESLMAQWSGAYKQIAIAGSIRRNIRSVKDIELLVQPIFDEKPIAAVAAQLGLFGGATGGQASSAERVSRLDTRLNDLAAQGIIFKERPHINQKGLWGEKQKKFWIKAQHGDGIGYLPVDLFICTPPAEWGALLTIRTGPADFSEMLMVYINDKTNLQQKDGRLVVRETGLGVPTPTEREYFKILGLPWVEPHKRTGDWVKRWIRMRRRPVRYQPPSSTALSGNRYQIAEEIDGKAETKSQRASEQTAAPNAGESVLTKPRAVDGGKLLSERIRNELTRLPGAHPTTLIPRLGCDPVSFRLALRTLKTLNVVSENHYGGLWLVDVVETPSVDGVRYTCDDDVRQALRARLERRAGISEG